MCLKIGLQAWPSIVRMKSVRGWWRWTISLMLLRYQSWLYYEDILAHCWYRYQESNSVCLERTQRRDILHMSFNICWLLLRSHYTCFVCNLRHSQFTVKHAVKYFTPRCAAIWQYEGQRRLSTRCKKRTVCFFNIPLLQSIWHRCAAL